MNAVQIYKTIVLIIRTIQYLIGAIKKADYLYHLNEIKQGAEQAKNPANPLPTRLEGAKRVQEALNRHAKDDKKTVGK